MTLEQVIELLLPRAWDFVTFDFYEDAVPFVFIRKSYPCDAAHRCVR